MKLAIRVLLVLYFVCNRQIATQSVPLPSRDCTPLSLVEKFKDFTNHCEYLKNAYEDSEITDFYAALPQVTIGRTFPLRGCVAGCLSGKNWRKYFSPTLSRGNGWGGFCFEESPYGVDFVSSIADQLTKKPVEVDDSWSSAVYDNRRGSGVWSVNYDSDGPILDGFEIHRMEMRQSAKGAVNGEVYVKSVDSASDAPYGVFHYSLFQICSGDGDYLDRPVTQLPGKDGFIY